MNSHIHQTNSNKYSCKMISNIHEYNLNQYNCKMTSIINQYNFHQYSCKMTSNWPGVLITWPDLGMDYGQECPISRNEINTEFVDTIPGTRLKLVLKAICGHSLGNYLHRLSNRPKTGRQLKTATKFGTGMGKYNFCFNTEKKFLLWQHLVL